jgi:tRNA(His) guanylyltransferase
MENLINWRQILKDNKVTIKFGATDMNKSLGDRMKGYENVNRNYLMKRTPVIIRLDGKAFHTYTKDCDRPFDPNLHDIRQNALDYLCKNIQGAIIGYSQSDELSIVLKDWQTFTTSAWFDNNIQKICSVSASMCTMLWNIEAGAYKNWEKVSPNAVFDSRVFNVPKEEVVNYLLWRQQDWERNSVQMLAQSLYSHKQIQGISNDALVGKIEQEFGIVWGNLESWKKQGEVWIKDLGLVENCLFKNEREQLEKLIG